MAKTALLVMEMQTDYFRDRRIAKFTYDTEALVGAVNAAIDRYAAAGADIIYLRQIYPDTTSNRIIFGFNIEGTEGAELWDGLHIASAHILNKNTADLFADEKIRTFFEAQGYTEYVLCGLDECGPVAATALGAKKSGADVKILRDAVGTRFDTRKKGETRAKMKINNIEYI